MLMSRSEAKKELKGKLTDYVNEVTVKSGNGKYVCPICGSGTGNNGKFTGAFEVKKDSERWTCYACHGGMEKDTGDIFDLVRILEGLEDFNDQFNFLCQKYGIEVISSTSDKNKNVTLTPEHSQDDINQIRKTTKELFDECASNYIKNSQSLANKAVEYMKTRGISEATTRKFEIGFVSCTNPYNDKYRENHIVIPYGNKDNPYYALRATDKLFFGEVKYIKPKSLDLPEWAITSESLVSEPLFNPEALYADKPCFICEGQIDAISIEEMGYHAIALGGQGMDKLEKKILDKRPSMPMILALDHDKRGIENTPKLKARLEKMGLECVEGVFQWSSYPKPCKDMNELLVADKELFKADLEKNFSKAMSLTPEGKYERKSTKYLLDDFRNVSDALDTEPIPTGYDLLDEKLGGGLQGELYIIGAVSSLGKSTFVLQLADSIAKTQKRDVLIFSLEMTNFDMVSKSLSRETYLISRQKESESLARTNRELTTRTIREALTPDQKGAITEAINHYAEYAEHIFIKDFLSSKDNNENYTRQSLATIERDINEHIKMRGTIPIVIVDYLQIIKPSDSHMTQKDNMDEAVHKFLTIAHKLKTPVIAISSLNRNNYKGGVSQESFKESGGIEYTADTLLGIQWRDADSDNFSLKRAKQQAKTDGYRALQVSLLKHRFNDPDTKVTFWFYPKYNYFENVKDNKTQDYNNSGDKVDYSKMQKVGIKKEG